MFHQSTSRSQRAKGSKAKRTVKVAVLLAVVVWLLYQTKHSYDKNKLATGVVDIKYGRKVNAGSQNENYIDIHTDNSHETAEMKVNGVDGDAWDSEETTENESEESQQGIANGNVDDNGVVNTEDAHDSLLLSSQMGSDSSEPVTEETTDTSDNSVEAVTDEKNSEVENGSLSNSSEENSNHVLSDNNEAPKDEENQSQMDFSSDDDDKSKADVSAEVATGDTVITENYSKSSDVEEVQSQETNDQDSIEEKPDDVVSSSAQNSEPNDSEMRSKEETPNEEVASDGVMYASSRGAPRRKELGLE